MSLRTYEIELQGIKMAIRSDSSPELVKASSELASKILQEVGSRAQRASPHQVAILGLLELAEEYVRAKGLVESERQQIADSLNPHFKKNSPTVEA